MTTTLTEANQVTVPEEIVREMRLEPGSRIEWTKGAIPGTILLEVGPNIEKLLDRCQELGKNLDRRILDKLIETRSREE